MRVFQTRYKKMQKPHVLVSRQTEKITAVTDEKILKQVKKTVLALNKLNERTDYCLLETDEREALWEIFQNSAVACGLRETDGDVTEEWREW